MKFELIIPNKYATIKKFRIYWSNLFLSKSIFEELNVKTLVIVVDGMRPDALIKTENAKFLLENSKYTLNARTVTPSVTLPCHMSLFHSGVSPDEEWEGKSLLK